MKTIKVGLGTCGISAGGEKVFQAFDKYSECCMEAATKVIEKCSGFKKHEEIADIIMCHKSSSNNFEFLKTKDVLINAGYHETAKLFCKTA